MEKVIFKTVEGLAALLFNTDLGNEGDFADTSMGEMTESIHERLIKEKRNLTEKDYDKIFMKAWAEELLNKYEYMYVRRDNNLYGYIDNKDVLVLDGSKLKLIYEDAQSRKG